MTRLVDFWKFLATHFLTEVAKMFDHFLAIFVKKLTCFQSTNCCGYFLGNFWMNLGYFLFQHLVTLNGTIALKFLFVIYSYLAITERLYSHFM